MGVFDDCTEEGGCETVLTVLGDDGALRRYVFDATLEITILDPEITEALAAL
jgi:Trm5-related predicted tRNA methylase